MRVENRSCIILGAGKGKRMNAGEKVLCEVALKPMLRWVIDAARGAGITELCVVTSGELGAIAEGCETYMQYERLGTGHAVLCARDFFESRGGDILVLCGDAPFVDSDTIQKAWEIHHGGDYDVTVIAAELQDPTGYGRMVRQGGKLCGIVEETDCDDATRAIREINAGAYWFKAGPMLEALGKINNHNAKGEYYLTHAITAIIEDGGSAACYTAPQPEVVLGANTPAQLLQLNEIAKDRIVARHLAEGVRFDSLDGIMIGPDVEIEPGTRILPGCILGGETKIGAGSVIGPNTRLSDTAVGKNCIIDSSQCEDSVIGDGAVIGPFARIRPACDLGSGVKIGNFVEIKNSVIGEGTSVAHLTYVGDADVGRFCNFGCGVVFVNYDGEAKYRTVVKDYAFLGCNTNLIAPVTVGEGAYTAAGVTVTQDVPDGALAMGRVRQQNKPGWAARKLKKYIEKKKNRSG